MRLMMMRMGCWTILVSLFATVASAQGLQPRRTLGNRLQRPATAAQPATRNPQPATSESASADSGGRSIEFNAAPVDMVFTVYQDLVGKTVLKDPQTPAATITLQPKKGQVLTDEDKIEAIETVLEMNGIHMEPYGEKFVRAIPRQAARKEGIPLILDEDMLPNTEKVVSTMIRFKNLPDINEAQKALEGFKSDKGQLQVFERTRSILVTDTQININRMREIAKEIDQPNPPMGLRRYERTFKYATAANVEKALTACYEFSKAEEEERKGKSSGTSQQTAHQPAANRPLLSQGLLRRPGQQAAQPQPTALESLFISAAMSDRALVRGRPLFIYDEENVPNKLIIVTYPENMELFDWIIEQLDVPTIPESDVKVYRLKYAEAEDVSDMINDLIGNTSGSKSSSKTANKAQPSTGGKSSPAPANKTSNSRSGESKAGELSKETTTVLADKRINGLVVMALTKDFPTIEQIIESMDIKLSQVLIETTIVEVRLGEGINCGMDWIQKGRQSAQLPDTTAKTLGANGLQMFNYTNGKGAVKPHEDVGTSFVEEIDEATSETWTRIGDGLTTLIPGAKYVDRAGLMNNWRGATSVGLGGGLNGGSDALAMTQGVASNLLSKSFSFIFDSDELGLAAILHAEETKNRSKYIAAPIIMTLDNKEAKIDATSKKQFLSGWTAQSGSVSGSGNPTPTYSSEDIGIKLTVTPKINPNGTVMLKVEEQYTQVSEKQDFLTPKPDGSYKTEQIDVPSKREMSADVLLENNQTVVFTGLTETQMVEGETGIPFLKDIPFIGRWLFGYTSKNEARVELLVFMTPYVLDDAQAAQVEALRRKKALSDPRPWDDHGWSLSSLADPVSKKEQMRRIKDLWRVQDEERRTKIAIEKAKVDRVKQLEKMSKDERELWLKMHKEELDDEEQDELEEKMLDEKSQEELKKLAAEIRAKKLGAAEKTIKAAETEAAAENERGKLDAEKKAEKREEAVKTK